MNREGRRCGRLRRTVTGPVLVLVATLVGVAACSGPPAPVALTLGPAPEWSWTPQAGPLRLGVTHMQVSLAPSDPPAALARGRAILAGSGPLQVQHLMGFGVLNPEPAPGVYDWASLDTRMALIRETRGETVLTLAGAPDWMKGGAAGTTDFSRIEVAPLPEHRQDFADLAAAAIRRYPQVRAVQVWNELKGFYDPRRNDWDLAGYLDLYRRVAAAVRAVRPGVAVGGPYVPLDAWANPSVAPSEHRGPWGVTDRRALDVVTGFLAAAPDADFLVVDGGSGTKDRGLVTDPETAADRFETLTRWLRARTTLPVVWAEFYPEPAGADDDPPPDAASGARAAVTLEAVAALARGGAAAAMLWQPQQSAAVDYAALWTDTTDADGGRPTALTAAWTWLAPRLAAGGVETGRSPDGRLLVFRHRDGLLLVNTSPDTPLVVSGAGAAPVDLAPSTSVVAPVAA